MENMNLDYFNGLADRLHDERTVHMTDMDIANLYPGTVRKRPIKTMNPDPKIDYAGDVVDIVDGEGRQIFSRHDGCDVTKATGDVDNFAIFFDVHDVYSPISDNRAKGRLSFQYEDMRMPNGKPNYRRVLFFIALGTQPLRFDDYFAQGEKVDLPDERLTVQTAFDENGVPQGLAKIYEWVSDTYYFGNFVDGELTGFLAVFGVKGRQYDFRDAFFYFKGRRTTIFEKQLNSLRVWRSKFDLTTIFWS